MIIQLNPKLLLLHNNLVCYEMLEDQDSAVVVVIALFCYKEKKRRRWMMNWYKEWQKFTHENLIRELRLNQPNDYHKFLRVDGPT